MVLFVLHPCGHFQISLFSSLLSSKLFSFIPFLNHIFPHWACWLLSALKIALHKLVVWRAWLLGKTGWPLCIQGKDLGCCTYICVIKERNGMSLGKGRWKNRHEKQGTHQSYFCVVLLLLVEREFNVLIVEMKQKLVVFNFHLKQEYAPDTTIFSLYYSV